jgi:hypothetical protein
VTAENPPSIRFATGTHVYKYSSLSHPERLQKILLENALYVPTVAELNDPVDGRPFLAPMSKDQMLCFLFSRNFNPTLSIAEQGALVRELEESIERVGHEQLMREMVETLNELQKSHRVYSMSKRYDNMGLWAKYANDHSGYCLEFARQGEFFGRATEVFYGESVPLDVYNPKSYFLWCKREDWRGEEEVRVIVLRGGSEKTVKFDSRLLTRIILGKNIAPEHEARVRGWAKEREPELVVAKAHFDALSQKLVLR